MRLYYSVFLISTHKMKRWDARQASQQNSDILGGFIKRSASFEITSEVMEVIFYPLFHQ